MIGSTFNLECFIFEHKFWVRECLPFRTEGVLPINNTPSIQLSKAYFCLAQRPREALPSLVFLRKWRTSVYYRFDYSLHVLSLPRHACDELLSHRFPKRHFWGKKQNRPCIFGFFRFPNRPCIVGFSIPFVWPLTIITCIHYYFFERPTCIHYCSAIFYLILVG